VQLFESVERMIKLAVAMLVGVPEMTPLAFMVKPAGNEPLDTM